MKNVLIQLVSSVEIGLSVGYVGLRQSCSFAYVTTVVTGR